jgi:prepilin-type processing-associated H-X9-DG protein
MKQLSVALASYASDYNGWLPNNASYRGSLSSYNGWNMLLANLEYMSGFPDEVKVSTLFRCPADNLSRTANDGVTTDDARTLRRASYMTNKGWDGAAANAGPAPNGYDGIQLTAAREPSATIAMTEAAPFTSRMEKVNWAPFSASDPIINQTDCVLKGSEYLIQRGSLLHGGRNNFIFIDGHVEYLKWSTDSSHKRLWTVAAD